MPLGPNEIPAPAGEVTFKTNINKCECKKCKKKCEFNFWEWVGEAMILTLAWLSSKDNKKNDPLWENE